MLAYLGDPDIQGMSDRAFKFILESYKGQVPLSRFFITPSAIPEGQHKEVVMRLCSKVSALCQFNFLHRMIPNFEEATNKAKEAGTRLALSPIVEIAAPALDQDTITVFGKVAEQIPEALILLNSDEYTSLPGNAEKAAHIRTWLIKNRRLLEHVTQLHVGKLKCFSIPFEAVLFKNLKEFKSGEFKRDLKLVQFWP